MKRKSLLALRLFSVVLLAGMLAGSPAPAGAQVMTERVSVDSSGAQGNGISGYSDISGDGRYVAFYSRSNNLVPGDGNNTWDVFVRDRQTRVTERVSVDSSGVEGNGNSHGPSISADGRYVAFESYADNLISGDTNGVRDVFVRDRQTGVTERVSVSSGGLEGNGSSHWPSISVDGRYVAFESDATNLDSGDTNGVRDVFVRDVGSGTTELVSLSTGGIQGSERSYISSISADGRYVIFRSWADNLVPGDTNGVMDVFVRDRQTGVTERVSVSSGGVEGNGESGGGHISADGRYVGFSSDADNLVPSDTNATPDVFVHDRQTGVTERVSESSSGVEGIGYSFGGSMSEDGRYIGFTSDAENLVPGDPNYWQDSYVHDRMTGVTQRVSLDSNGVSGTFRSYAPNISPDGRYVAFDSESRDLVPGDTNNVTDVFVRLAQSIGLPVFGGNNYDLDPEADIGIFRPSTGTWYIQGSPGVKFGVKKGDRPVPGKYGVSGRADIAIYRNSNATWYIRNGPTIVWGKNAGDVPVPADYDGDGLTDIAVYRPTNGTWYIRNGPTVRWGIQPGDIPVPADYDGDGAIDIAVFRPSNGYWYIRGVGNFQYGVQYGDIPVPGDYNGDGVTDIAVYRHSNGYWYIRGVGSYQWGIKPEDIPVQADYDADGATDIAVYRPSTGWWYIRGVGNVRYGIQWGDSPVTRGE